jgi:hypothetical protein
MSIGNDLQEMEVSTKKSVTAVNKSARPADAMPKLTTGMPPGQTGSWEDLGGPTPFNSRSTDDSNKLKTPGKTLKQVSNVVTKGAKAAEGMKGMKGMSAEESEYEEELVEKAHEEGEEGCGDDKEDEKEDKKMKMKKMMKMKEEADEEGEEEGEEVEEEVEEVEEDYELDFSEDVKALIGDEDLSEDFKSKASLIFESAVRTKVNDIRESLQQRYDQSMSEEIVTIKEELTERVDSYLEYVSGEWIEENSLQIETGLKGQLSESFMGGLKTLFEEHYVEIPEDKYDVLEGMVGRLDEMESKLNEQIDRNVQLNRRLSEAVSDTILNDVSEGLALTQKEKLSSLAESVEFESEEDYREKLETLKESYFTRTAPVASSEEVLTEGVSEDLSPRMDSYIKAVTKFSK